MKRLWILLVVVLCGCKTVPNKMVVATDMIPDNINTNVAVFVSAKNKNVAIEMQEKLNKVMSENNIQTSMTGVVPTKITVEVQKSEVQWTAYTEGLNRYYTDIDRLTIKANFTAPQALGAYFSVEIALDSRVDGATMSKSGFKDKEDLNSLIGRAAIFIAKIYLNVSRNQQIGIEGRWHDIIGESKITIAQKDNEFLGVVDALQYGNIGFSKKDSVYMINPPRKENETLVSEGFYKVNYLNGSSAWLPAKFYIYGCLLMIDPTSANAPVGKSFLVGECDSAQ